MFQYWTDLPRDVRDGRMYKKTGFLLRYTRQICAVCHKLVEFNVLYEPCVRCGLECCARCADYKTDNDLGSKGSVCRHCEYTD